LEPLLTDERLMRMDPLETVHEFLARIGARDLDRACELLAEEVEYDNVPMGKVFGPVAVKAFLEPIVAPGRVEDLDWVVHREAASGNIVMNERTDRFKLNGRWVDLPACGVFELDGRGKIALWRDYFDQAAVTEAFKDFAE
jgi:limonene-1,2-epoxide hydrolase